MWYDGPLIFKLSVDPLTGVDPGGGGGGGYIPPPPPTFWGRGMVCTNIPPPPLFEDKMT